MDIDNICSFGTCEHTNGNFVVDSYNTKDHILMCTDCNNYLNCVRENHYDNNNDNACDVCGYTAPVDPATCSHGDTYAYNCWDGTHNISCNRCGTDIVIGEAHTDADNDNICDKCYASIN